MYAERNFKTKRELREAVLLWRAWYDNKDQWEKDHPEQEPPSAVLYYQPGGIFPTTPNGTVYLEGPHYPQPHRWYAQCEAKAGRIWRVIK